MLCTQWNCPEAVGALQERIKKCSSSRIFVSTGVVPVLTYMETNSARERAVAVEPRKQTMKP